MATEAGLITESRLVSDVVYLKLGLVAEVGYRFFLLLLGRSAVFCRACAPVGVAGNAPLLGGLLAATQHSEKFLSKPKLG